MPTNQELRTETVPALRRPMDRRQFMRRAAVVGVGAAVMPGFLAACAAEATATPIPTPTPTAAPTATATATATPAPTPVPSSFEGGVNPLFVVGNGITREDIAVPSGGAQISSYMARPVGDGPWPGVVVIHENRGLVPYVRDVVDGLASSGYVALAPDLLSREGGIAQVASVSGALNAARDSGQAAGDVLALIEFLKRRSDVAKIGITGFCWGGQIVWSVATMSSDIAAAVPFYGSNPPLDAVPNITAAVYAVYGALDSRINAGIDDITTALNAAGTTWDSKVYADSSHAFMNHTRESRYSAATAPQAWADTLAWFDQHLRS
ncbi:MAG: dienelactone hydrolase family protein [Chloroflexi bacterium]|nr:dienelactone hydrolase family protein [Chloroflexota bacterium]